MSYPGSAHGKDGWPVGKALLSGYSSLHSSFSAASVGTMNTEWDLPSPGTYTQCKTSIGRSLGIFKHFIQMGFTISVMVASWQLYAPGFNIRIKIQVCLSFLWIDSFGCMEAFSSVFYVWVSLFFDFD